MAGRLIGWSGKRIAGIRESLAQYGWSQIDIANSLRGAEHRIVTVTAESALAARAITLLAQGPPTHPPLTPTPNHPPPLHCRPLVLV